MTIGFVYILLNPAFPDRIKIGRTTRPTLDRANELSRQTGVPERYVVIYDHLVGDCQAVELALHLRFAASRASQSKEFFRVQPKDAILALQSLAASYPVPQEAPHVRVSLFEFFRSRFGRYLRPDITDIALVQFGDACALEVTSGSGLELDDIPIQLFEPNGHLHEAAEKNAAQVRSLDEYDLIMVTNLFTAVAAKGIAERWERTDPPSAPDDGA
ncbi:MAG: GIY-YIG nuclease family protein [Acidobacteriota bacterium]